MRSSPLDGHRCLKLPVRLLPRKYQFTHAAHALSGEELPNSRRPVAVRFEQTAANIFFAQTIDANQLVTSLLTAFQYDRTLGNAQFFRQKATQGCIRFSFDRWCLQFDLNRVAMFSHDRIELRAWNDVDSDSGHWLTHTLAIYFPIDKKD